MPNVPSLKKLSMAAVYHLELNEVLQHQDAGMSIIVAKNHFDFTDSLHTHLSFPKELHELALMGLNTSYQTLVLLPFEKQLKQQQTGYQNYSAEDKTSELLTKLTLREFEGFKALYWLARAHDLQDIVCFFESKKKQDCPMLFLSETRNGVVSKIAEIGDQENLDKLLQLANNPSERMAMLTSAIEGACKAGQIDMLHILFAGASQTEVDKASCHHYLTDPENLPRLLSKACASGHLESVEFILERVPETQHPLIISEVDQGYQYHALREACRSGNTQVVDRLLKPFSQKEIDQIFLPTVEQTKNLPLPFPYASILAYDELSINQHILTNVVSAECREKIVTSDFFAQSLAQIGGKQAQERAFSLLTKEFNELKKPLESAESEKSHSRLQGYPFFSEASSSRAENESISKNRLGDSLLFSLEESEVNETEKNQKEKQRCRLTKS